MGTNISPLASIDRRASLGENVAIGPFSVVGPNVSIGDNTELMNSVTICGHVEIGSSNLLFPNVMIGGAPQDISYRGSDTQVIIGENNTFRECVTVNRASEKENGVTVIGSDNYMMANCHVAHDCNVGNHVIMANGTLLGGHVRIYDHASISGAAAIHHFTTIGSYSFISGLSRVLHDVPPFMLVEGSPARPRCINIVALKRHGFDPDSIAAIAEAHRLIYRQKLGLQQAREILRSNNKLTPEVQHLLEFVQHQSEGRHGRGQESWKKVA